MPTPLRFKVFTEECLQEVQGFDCGDDPWAKLAAEWIQCVNPSNSARVSMQQGTTVFLYYLLSGELVGFGSLGGTNRHFSKHMPPSGIIPQFGVRRQFRKYPPDAIWQDRVSTTILSDLIERARELSYRTLSLWVHKDNVGGRTLYTRIGFKEYKRPNDAGYQTMLLKLEPPP